MPANEFAEMLAVFDRWIATQERDGWASPDVENYARRVRNGPLGVRQQQGAAQGSD